MPSILFLLALVVVASNAAGPCTNATGLETAETAAFILTGGAGIAVSGANAATFLTNGSAGQSPTVIGVLCTNPKVVCTNVVDEDNTPAAMAVASEISCIIANGFLKSVGTAQVLPTTSVPTPLIPGVYFSASTIQFTGTIVLNGMGDTNAIFVFQAGSSLTTASNAVVQLINGTQPCNVFWIIGSSATLGQNTTFVGTIYAQISITTVTGSTVHGRLFANVGQITLGASNVTSPNCTAFGGRSTGCPNVDDCSPTTPTPTVASSTPVPTSASSSVTASPSPSPSTATPVPATPTPPVTGNPLWFIGWVIAGLILLLGFLAMGGYFVASRDRRRRRRGEGELDEPARM